MNSFRRRSFGHNAAPAVALTLAALLVAIPAQVSIGADQAVPATPSAYARDIRAAQKAIDAGEPRRALELLEKRSPAAGQVNAGDFAWRYLWQLANASTIAAAPSNARDTMPGLVPRNIESPLIFLPGGNIIASSCADDIARQFDLTTLKPIVEMAGVKDPLVMCSDGHTLVASGYSGLQVWDLRSQNLAPIWFFPRGDDWKISAFSRDGHWAVVGQNNGQLQFIDVIQRRELTNLVAHQGAIRTLAVSPDDHTVASAGMDRSVRLWDFTRRAGQGMLNDHSNTVVALAFSPDGKTLASAGADRVIRLWRIGSSTAPQRLSGHDGTVWSLAFSPDGRTLASGSADDSVRLWNPAAGTELVRLQAGDSATGNSSRGPARLAFSPDGNLLAARLFDGTLRVWRAAEVAAGVTTVRQ